MTARLHGARALMGVAGTRHEPVDEVFIAPRIAASRAAMGIEAFDAALAEGMTLSHEASVAEAEAWLARVDGD